MPETNPHCSHRPPCPGCPRWLEPGLDPQVQQALDRLAAREGITTPAVASGPAFGYRHRARLAVRGRSRSPKVGIFQPGSHRIVDIPHCPVHHPLINRVASVLKQAIRRTGVTPYADAPHRGDLRSVQVVIERESQTAQVVLVANDDDPGPLASLAQALSEQLGDALHSLWWNGNPERTNVILGEHWKHLLGPEAVRERARGVAVFHPPGAFGQSNLDLADEMLERIAVRVPASARIVEFYGGCGAIGLRLLPEARALTINELNPHSLRGLELGRDALAPDVAERLAVAAGSAGDHAKALLEGCDVAIADPPRKGLDPGLLEALVSTPPERFIYVSCGHASFMRDCDALLASKRLRLAALETFLLFPHTSHVETLATFERKAD